MNNTADRMHNLPPYFFAQIAATIAEMRAEGRDVIRLDVGAPDAPPAPHIISALAESAARPDTHSYQPYRGTPELRRAWSQMYQRLYAVDLDPDTEVVPLLGSKEGIFHLTQAHVNPGEVVLVPDPAYPTYRRAALFAGGEVVPMPLRAENGFRPDLTALPADVARRAKLLWLNYPNNPTAGVADATFFEEALEFARSHEILLCHDAPYAQVTYDGYRAMSVLEIAGAKEVAVELNSLSKSHNMAGWRVGAALGNPAALQALYVLKTNIDSSQFLPVMHAATAAMTGDQTWLAGRNETYRVRRDLLVETLNEIGMHAQTPPATLYVWARVPAGRGSAEFTRSLLAATGVSLTPGTAFGAHGEGFVRISLGAPTDRIEAACRRLKAWAG